MAALLGLAPLHWLCPVITSHEKSRSSCQCQCQGCALPWHIVIDGQTDMTLTLPSKLAAKAADFRESSYGACRATLVLKDGRRIFDVTLAWGSDLVQIDGEPVEKKQLDFGVTDVVDVLPWP